MRKGTPGRRPQGRDAAVLISDDYIGRGISPINAKAWIIPRNASLALGSQYRLLCRLPRNRASN